MNLAGIFHGIRIRLAQKDKITEKVFSDIETLEKMLENLGDKHKTPRSGTRLVTDKIYLQITGLQVLLVSKLEYLLKSKGIINKQNGLIEKIKNTPILSKLEADWIIYLILIRHTIVHNGDYFDAKFHKAFKKHIRELKLEIPEDSVRLTSMDIEGLLLVTKLIKKFILLDIVKDLWTDEEIKIVEESLR